jgi:hypothetical protein
MIAFVIYTVLALCEVGIKFLFVLCERFRFQVISEEKVTVLTENTVQIRCTSSGIQNTNKKLIRIIIY